MPETRYLRVGLPFLSASKRCKSALFALTTTVVALSGGCGKGKTAEAAPPVCRRPLETPAGTGTGCTATRP